MSVVSIDSLPKPVYTDLPLYRWTVEHYHKLIQDGTLTEDDPVELLEGAIVFKRPKNPPHETSTGCLTDILTPILPKGWHLRTQGPVTLDDGEPEPDGAIVRGVRKDYSARHPGPSDTAIVIEVAESSLSRDRGIKLRSYARAGIACYWIINLIDRQIEVYTQPDATVESPTYRQCTILSAAQSLPLILDGQTIAQLAVGDPLPAAT